MVHRRRIICIGAREWRAGPENLAGVKRDCPKEKMRTLVSGRSRRPSYEKLGVLSRIRPSTSAYTHLSLALPTPPYTPAYTTKRGGGGGDGHDIRRNKCKHIVELRSRSFDDRCPVHSDNVCAGVCVYGKRSASGRTCAGWVVWFSNAFSGLSGHLDDQATPFLSHCVIRVFRASAAVEPFSWEFVPGRTCDTNEKWVL